MISSLTLKNNICYRKIGSIKKTITFAVTVFLFTHVCDCHVLLSAHPELSILYLQPSAQLLSTSLRAALNART